MMSQSRRVYVPSGVSSFFEICDRSSEGNRLEDPLRIGARGGGFIIEKGTTTIASNPPELIRDEVLINGRVYSGARTSLGVIRLIRSEFNIPPVRISHVILPPIGQGFGTSGAGALATSVAIGDLFHLKFSLSRAADFAHISEIENLTGLGTVISLASGTGAVGLVTEPGSFSMGKTDAILIDPSDFVLVCATFGPIKKSIVLSDEHSRLKVNEFGRIALQRILDNPTPDVLLTESRKFSELSGLGSKDLLKISDAASKLGAVGATSNMIGNAIHCLVERSKYDSFMERFSNMVPRESIFESSLIQSGPRILSETA